MMTVFTTAKPFKGHNAIIQRNALNSWKLLDPSVEIIIFGDDEGSAEVCAAMDLRHEPHVERTEFGANRVDQMFKRAQQIASHDVVCYANCDIVLMADFRKALGEVCNRPGSFLMIGKRWDTDVTSSLDFGDVRWERELRARALAQRAKRRFEVDYFVFRRGLFSDIPPFGIGRLYWDHWLVWWARESGAAVIDASIAVTAVHQNHDYSHHAAGRQGVWEGVEPKRNFELAGGRKHMVSFEGATHLLLPPGLVFPTPHRKFVSGAVNTFQRQVFNIFVHKTFPLRRVLGLRVESVRKLLHR